MTPSLLFLSGIALILAGLVALRAPDRFGEALRYAVQQGRPIALRIPLALLAATWLAILIPPEAIGSLLGEEMAFSGILIASVLGAVLPGGPMIAFPLALIVWSMGAGTPQMVALLSSWAIFAVQRTLVYEMPIMGTRFVLLKFAASWMLPPLSGLLAWGLLALPL